MDATGVQQPAAPSDSTQDGTLISSQTVMGSFTSNNTAFDNMFQNGQSAKLIPLRTEGSSFLTPV
jgi:hypothetical protein